MDLLDVLKEPFYRIIAAIKNVFNNAAERGKHSLDNLAKK